MSDLKLVPFSDENAATVLAWRNSDRIRSNMLDDSIIGKVDHSKFLSALASDKSREYYVVELRGSPVASLYFTGLGDAEVTWGCYIGVEKTIPGLFVALVVIAIKYSFRLESTRILRSEVATHNISPVKLNRYLDIPECGRKARMTSSGKEVEFIEYQLHYRSIDNVLHKAEKIVPSSIKASCETIIVE